MLLIVSVVVLVGVVLATVPALVSTLHTLDRQQDRYIPSATATNALLTAALNEETGVRGYALTENASFLQPYEEGTASYATAMRQLRSSSTPPGLADDVTKTDDAFQRWHEYATGIVSSIRSGDIQAARAVIATGRGKTLFDAFRERQNTLSVALDNRIVVNRRSLRSQVERSLAGLVVAVAIGFAATAALWFWWRRWGRHNAHREQELADTAVLMQSAIDATNDPIFAKDRGGRHILVNRARVESLTGGRGDAELIGEPVDAFVAPELAAQIRRDEEEIMRSGVEVVLEEELEYPDGPRAFLTTKSPLHDARGRVTGIVGVARDITEDRELLVERERLYKAEHRLATNLQRAMLGNSEIDDDRLAICAQYQPAVADLVVGGDWYDVVELPNGTVGLIVGDVVGRGIDAATAMGQLRSALTALSYGQADPAQALEGLDLFARTIPNAMSATCISVVVDPANEQLVYSTAGHMPPLVVSPAGQPTYLDEVPDTPLATSRIPRRRRSRSVPFPVGSTLVLFTDGLVERRTESIDAGLGRLAAVMTRHHELNVDEVCERILDEMLSDQRNQDDVAIVTARLMSATSRTFGVTISSDMLEARRARHALDQWLGSSHLGEQARAEIGLAVGEAIANSVEHAYRDGHGLIDVTAAIVGDRLRVTVHDHGNWREPDGDSLRGRGITLMRALMDDVDIRTTGDGTLITLEVGVIEHRAFA